MFPQTSVSAASKSEPLSSLAARRLGNITLPPQLIPLDQIDN
jgi:hypothetical protein